MMIEGGLYIFGAIKTAGFAKVAELVDALDLGSSGREAIGVRFPSFAYFNLELSVP